MEMIRDVTPVGRTIAEVQHHIADVTGGGAALRIGR